MIDMQRLQAFQYELMPNSETQRLMRRFAGSCRFVYNKALALQQDNHEAGEKFIGYVAMAARLPLWKREVGQEWLKDAPSTEVQQQLELGTRQKPKFKKSTPKSPMPAAISGTKRRTLSAKTTR